MHRSTTQTALPLLRSGAVSSPPASYPQLTIPAATPAEQAPIIALVEQVLAAKAAGAPTAALEAAIDALVAARYGLTPAEAALLGA